MNRTIKLHVAGTPAPQPRPRVTRTGHAYNPPTADKWKVQVRAAWEAAGIAPFERHLRMGLEFTFARPPSHFRKSGELTKAAPPEHVGTPDVDNLAKAVMDALGDCKAFRNDSFIISLGASKAYGAESGCAITITEQD